MISWNINIHKMSRFCFNSINLLPHLLFFLRNCQWFYFLFVSIKQQDIMVKFKASPSQIRPPIISKIIQRLHSLTFLTLLFAIFEKQCPLLEATRSSNIQQRLSFKRKAQIRPCSNLAFLWSPFSIHAHFKILCG